MNQYVAFLRTNKNTDTCTDTLILLSLCKRRVDSMQIKDTDTIIYKFLIIRMCMGYVIST